MTMPTPIAAMLATIAKNTGTDCMALAASLRPSASKNQRFHQLRAA